MAGETVVIDSLDLKNYRNYDILDMNFDKNVNIIYGDNAQGKTNILESIYTVSYTHLTLPTTSRV